MTKIRSGIEGGPTDDAADHGAPAVDCGHVVSGQWFGSHCPVGRLTINWSFTQDCSTAPDIPRPHSHRARTWTWGTQCPSSCL